VSWNLITDDWRLKLLALGLAILMLGAVAFSENPPTTGSVTVQPTYNIAPNPVVLINPPQSITVNYSGLADVIKNVNTHNMVVTVDATHASPGSQVKLNVVARSLLGNQVNVTQPTPIAVNIDTLDGIDLPVTVTAQAAAGWSIDTVNTRAVCPGAQKSNPCTVHFEGPKSWEKGLQAYVVYPTPVNVGTIDSPGYNIQVKNDSGQVDLSAIPTTPAASLDVTTASVHIVAHPGSTSSTVPLLDSPPSHGPPNGYRVTGVTISPVLVTITSSDPAALGKIHNITLPPVDLSKYTSSPPPFQVTIQYPDGVAGSPATATVTYQISPNPNVSRSPSPTPT
jgi:YbbR-like protein